MEIQLNGSQKNLITKLANEEGIEEFELETKEGGEGSFGTIIAVTVKGKNKKLELILKTAFNDEKVRTVNPIARAYLREIYIYEQVFPVFKKFEEKFGVTDGFSAYPKIYGSIQTATYETLALENLSDSGFKLWNCREGMDGDHVSIILKEYAKLHAVSLAMLHKEVDVFNQLTENLTNVFETHSLAIVQFALELGKRAVVGNELATEALERQGPIVERFVCELLEHCSSKMAVIHKDGWCNNFMFKYEESGKPVEANIIDWQLSERSLPILDLSYFIFTCGSPEVVVNFVEYIDIYYKTLRESLAKLSCNPDEIYPPNLFAVQWVKFSKFGLYMALIMIKIMMSEKNELTDIRQMARSGMSFMDRINFESAHNDAYNKRVATIINVMAQHRLI